MAKTTYYLRPSADISVGHALVPADSPNAYSLINEEVSDGSSTYIATTAVKGETVVQTSSFKMSGTNPTNTKLIIGVTVSATASSGLTGSSISSITATVNGQSFALSRVTNGIEVFVTTVNYTSQAFVDAITSCDVFPEITVSITTSKTVEADAKTVTQSTITQLYVKIDCGIGALIKVDNAWKGAYDVYRKSNGAWTLLEDGYSFVGSRLHRMGHRQEYLLATAATCTATGSTDGYRCSICGETLRFQNIIPAKGHVDENGDNVCDVCEAVLCTADSHAAVTDSAIAATCVETGLTEGSHCSACGEVIVAQQITDINPNKHARVVVSDKAVAATCVETGLTEGKYCSACGVVISSQQVTDINPNKHKKIVTSKAVAATCVETGLTEGKYCSACGVITVAQQVVPATGIHNYVVLTNKEECSMCGDVIRRFGVEFYKTDESFNCGDYLAATTVGGYAIFGGGEASSATSTNVVNAYNASLTKSTPTPLSVARQRLAATTVGNYALFGGGNNGNVTGEEKVVDAYNTSLTRVIPTSFSSDNFNFAATSVGNYALFPCDDIGNAYDNSLTKVEFATLSQDRSFFAATSVGNYALFGGGVVKSLFSSNTYYDIVDVYNTSLTRSIATPLSVARYDLPATSVGNYALFGGGLNGNKNIDAYNTSLTRSNPTSLDRLTTYEPATSVGNYALFGNSNIYDSNLVKQAYSNIASNEYGAATYIGKFALFNGSAYINHDMP